MFRVFAEDAVNKQITQSDSDMHGGKSVNLAVYRDRVSISNMSGDSMNVISKKEVILNCQLST